MPRPEAPSGSPEAEGARRSGPSGRAGETGMPMPPLGQGPRGWRERVAREVGRPSLRRRIGRPARRVGTVGRRARTSRARCWRPYGGEPPEENLAVLRCGPLPLREPAQWPVDIPAGIAALGRLGTRDVTPRTPRPPSPTRMSHVAHTPLVGWRQERLKHIVLGMSTLVSSGDSRLRSVTCPRARPEGSAHPDGQAAKRFRTDPGSRSTGGSRSRPARGRDGARRHRDRGHPTSARTAWGHSTFPCSTRTGISCARCTGCQPESGAGARVESRRRPRSPVFASGAPRLALASFGLLQSSIAGLFEFGPPRPTRGRAHSGRTLSHSGKGACFARYPS